MVSLLNWYKPIIGSFPPIVVQIIVWIEWCNGKCFIAKTCKGVDHVSADKRINVFNIKGSCNNSLRYRNVFYS